MAFQKKKRKTIKLDDKDEYKGVVTPISLNSAILLFKKKESVF